MHQRGVDTVSCVGETTATEVPATPPNVTDVEPVTNPVPVIVTAVPPLHEPMDGVMLVTVGMDGVRPTTEAGIDR